MGDKSGCRSFTFSCSNVRWLCTVDHPDVVEADIKTLCIIIAFYWSGKYLLNFFKPNICTRLIGVQHGITVSSKCHYIYKPRLSFFFITKLTADTFKKKKSRHRLLYILFCSPSGSNKQIKLMFVTCCGEVDSRVDRELEAGNARTKRFDTRVAQRTSFSWPSYWMGYLSLILTQVFTEYVPLPLHYKSKCSKLKLFSIKEKYSFAKLKVLEYFLIFTKKLMFPKGPKMYTRECLRIF